jgi:hypothetical protein
MRVVPVIACLMIGLISQTSSGFTRSGSEEYQEALISKTRSANQLRPDRAPEGKIIERIVIAPYDVILQEDPFPQFLNWFHVTTQPEVIQRELLFREGDRWSEAQISETARNLRNYLFIAAGRIVACEGSDPQHVVALVVTKDLWSLRANTAFSFVGTELEVLDMELSEHNLLGHTKRATLDFGLNLASWYAGEQYRDPRLLGTELLLKQRADLIVNRGSGHLEGGVTSLSLEQPLYTLDTPWAWNLSGSYRKDIYRFFSAGSLSLVFIPGTGEPLPYLFNREQLDFKAVLTRSLGHEHKHDFNSGYRAFVHNYSTPAPPTPVLPATTAGFESQVLPRTESAGMLFAGMHSYEATYRELIDIQTFALTEDYRLGLDFNAEMRWASRVFGFSSAFIQPLVTADWSWLVSDDLLTLGSGFNARYQPEISPASDWEDVYGTIRVRNVSPRLGFLRLHSGLRYVRRYNDLDHGFDALGGDSSLRGYPSAFFHGANLWSGNFEVRTAPVALATLHFGFATFFDIGGAADNLDAMGAHASAGAGIRVGLPQFNRELLRVDFGFPLETIQGASPAYIVAQYGQAF